MSFGSPQRIMFPWQSIKKASLAVCSVYSAGCSVCCRAEACSQLDVSWDSGDRVIKHFSMWLLLIHSSGRAYRFICILQTVVVTIKKIWQHFMEQSKWSTGAWKLITSSLLPVALFDWMWTTCRMKQQFSVWTVQMCENGLISHTPAVPNRQNMWALVLPVSHTTC